SHGAVGRRDRPHVGRTRSTHDLRRAERLVVPRDAVAVVRLRHDHADRRSGARALAANSDSRRELPPGRHASFASIASNASHTRKILTIWTEPRRHAGEVVRSRDELNYAREIQLSMLPDAAPQIDWLDVAGVSIPATEVGGDYFDYFDVGGRLAIVSGDVAGH